MPLSGQDDTKGDVYVLRRFRIGRPYKPKPGVNADRIDTDMFYNDGVYDEYPLSKERYENRRRRERMKIARVNNWAWEALKALDDERPMPPTTRLVLPEVLQAFYAIGTSGLTRPEICRMLNRDGGKVSGCMTDLHAAGIIFPLEGVRR